METTTSREAKMPRYKLYTDRVTDYTTEAQSPAKALKELAKMAGYTLDKQDGRYGTATDGTRLTALTMQWSRAHYADARTTRL